MISPLRNDAEWRDWARSVSRKLDFLIEQQTKTENLIMAKIEDLVAEVAEETTVVGSVSALMDGLTAAINDLRTQLANAGLDTAAADNLLAQMRANKAALTDAVTRNSIDVIQP